MNLLHGFGRRSVLRRARPRGSRAPLLGGLWLRWRTRWRADDLDAQLADGADPSDSDQLSVRAGQLRSSETRARLAAVLKMTVELADEVAPAGRREEIRVCRTLLLDLARCIRQAPGVDIRGLAMTAVLVDGLSSPLRTGGATESLASAAYAALFALEPQQSRG